MLTFVNSENTSVIEKTFEATDANLYPVLDMIEAELEKRDCLPKVQMTISVIVEEIFVNIAHYAYGDQTGNATIQLCFNEDDVAIRFIDSGMEFNPLAKEDPDITLSAEERSIGGLGIFMVKNTMDEVTYQRDGDKNILTIQKDIHRR